MGPPDQLIRASRLLINSTDSGCGNPTSRSRSLDLVHLRTHDFRRADRSIERRFLDHGSEFEGRFVVYKSLLSSHAEAHDTLIVVRANADTAGLNNLHLLWV